MLRDTLEEAIEAARRGAAFGGSPSLPWWPRRVVPLEQPVEVNSQSETFMVMLTA